MDKPFRFIAELPTLGESQVSLMTTISRESKETVPDSSSILLTNDLELDRNKEGKAYEVLLPNLIFRRFRQLVCYGSHKNLSSNKNLNNSQILAESLLNLVDNHSESVDKALDGNICETLKCVDVLITEISTTSTEAIKAKLSKDSVEKLNGRRDEVIEYCRYKFPNFSKDKPLRRITRSGGKSANEKLGSDIVALVKYCCSGERQLRLMSCSKSLRLHILKCRLLVHKVKKQ